MFIIIIIVIVVVVIIIIIIIIIVIVIKQAKREQIMLFGIDQRGSNINPKGEVDSASLVLPLQYQHLTSKMWDVSKQEKHKITPFSIDWQRSKKAPRVSWIPCEVPMRAK